MRNFTPLDFATFAQEQLNRISPLEADNKDLLASRDSAVNSTLDLSGKLIDKIESLKLELSIAKTENIKLEMEVVELQKGSQEKLLRDAIEDATSHILANEPIISDNELSQAQRLAFAKQVIHAVMQRLVKAETVRDTSHLAIENDDGIPF